MSKEKIGRSLILAGFIIIVIGVVISLFQEEEEIKNIKNLIKEADRIIKENA
ncbi:MAG: hypothetical protein RMJ51_05235 [Candidatus Calescibacterium sp.]|nr:hypothetical protein [Candidatus Calescibacterium sp.]MCX7972484.1 hypothetical protein [bacterium]MDW8195624.1 hypothetical protein [Candidatus Calescibacterium sp.]